MGKAANLILPRRRFWHVGLFSTGEANYRETNQDKRIDSGEELMLAGSLAASVSRWGNQKLILIAERRVPVFSQLDCTTIAIQKRTASVRLREKLDSSFWSYLCQSYQDVDRVLAGFRIFRIIDFVKIGSFFAYSIFANKSLTFASKQTISTCKSRTQFGHIFQFITHKTFFKCRRMNF